MNVVLTTLCFEKVMDRFDFEKVKKVMDLLNWTWVGYNGVPTIVEIKDKCRNLCLRLIQEKENCNIDSISTCGFRVSYSEGVAEIEFILESDMWDETWKEEEENE